jgi:hypothetical protein
MFPSKYLEAADLRGKEHVVEIESIEQDELVGENGETIEKWLFKYRGHKKLHVMNVTNGRSIAVMYGDDPHGWIDKAITIYPTKDRYGRKQVDCIRVKETIPQVQTKQDLQPRQLNEDEEVYL